MTNPRPINCVADEARRILAGQTTQLRRYNDHWFNYAKPGDLFWLREPHRFLLQYDHLAPSVINNIFAAGPPLHFDADGPQIEPFGKTRFARNLLRTLSRAVLKIKTIKTVPLQDWAPCDVAALGQDRSEYARDWNANRRNVNNFGVSPHARAAFWSDNPTVRVINFTLIRTNIDQLLLEDAA